MYMIVSTLDRLFKDMRSTITKRYISLINWYNTVEH